jgi:hypothetical protein
LHLAAGVEVVAMVTGGEVIWESMSPSIFSIGVLYRGVGSRTRDDHRVGASAMSIHTLVKTQDLGSSYIDAHYSVSLLKMVD